MLEKLGPIPTLWLKNFSSYSRLNGRPSTFLCIFYAFLGDEIPFNIQPLILSTNNKHSPLPILAHVISAILLPPCKDVYNGFFLLLTRILIHVIENLRRVSPKVSDKDLTNIFAWSGVVHAGVVSFCKLYS